jgi:hypothetical protein
VLKVLLRVDSVGKPARRLIESGEFSVGWDSKWRQCWTGISRDVDPSLLTDLYANTLNLPNPNRAPIQGVLR